MAILEQDIGGGGSTIGPLVFAMLEDSTSYCSRHFPSGSYDCIVGLVALMGSTTDSVVSHDALEHSMVLGEKTQLSPKQIKIISIASFSAAYLAILAVPSLHIAR